MSTPAPERSPWIAFLVCALGTFMSTLDASVVNVALPTLVRELETNIGNVEWVVTSYLLVLTATLLVFGKLSDRLGRRNVYVGGLVVFTIASVLCATAQGVWSLVLWRAVQGVGASMLTAVGPALLVDAFPENRRGRALGLLAIAVGGGLITGPAIGGMILGLLNWRWIFLLNLPVGGLAILVSFWALPKGDSRESEPFDWPGALLGTLALAAVLGLTSLGPQLGWLSPFTLSFAAIFVAASVGFVVVERRAPAPTFDLAMLTVPRIREGLIACLLSFVAVFLPIYLIPFYLQDIVGMTPLEMGLTMTTLPIMLLISSPFAGWVTDRYGAVRVAPAGMIGLALALSVLAWLGVAASALVIGAALAGVGFGMGMFSSPNNAEVLSTVGTSKRGSLSAALAVNRNLGTVLGITAASTLFQILYQRGAGKTYTFVEGTVPNVGAFDVAFRVPMYVGTGVAIVTAIIAWITMSPLAKSRKPEDLSAATDTETETVVPTAPP